MTNWLGASQSICMGARIHPCTRLQIIFIMYVLKYAAVELIVACIKLHMLARHLLGARALRAGNYSHLHCMVYILALKLDQRYSQERPRSAKLQVEKIMCCVE